MEITAAENGFIIKTVEDKSVLSILHPPQFQLSNTYREEHTLVQTRDFEELTTRVRKFFGETEKLDDTVRGGHR